MEQSFSIAARFTESLLLVLWFAGISGFYCVNSSFVEVLFRLRLVRVKVLSQDAHLSHAIVRIVANLAHLNLQEVRSLLVLENLLSRMS